MRRAKLARAAAAGPLREYYCAPAPVVTTECCHQEFLSVDLETTGLNAKTDLILSIGWVLVRDCTVDLSQRGHLLVKQACEINAASAVIHGIFDDRLAQGIPLQSALEQFLPLLAGRVMIAHHSHIETSFLSAACRQVYGAPLNVLCADTLLMEKRFFDKKGQVPRKGELRLDAVRQRYNLPRYRAHNAMVDAVSAAELFLAQLQYRTGNGTLSIRDVAS
ncbi:MAG: exonuclease domain-containing protein [Magnetospiraceae bacterium]